MRAESSVFRAVQKPMTVFGVAPFHLFVIGGGAFAVLIVFIAIGMAKTGTALALGNLGFFWYKVFRKTQANHHYQSTHFVAPRFWRTKKLRILLAGPPPIQRREGKT